MGTSGHDEGRFCFVRKPIVNAWLLAVAAGASFGQGTAPLKFEVASVKPAGPPSPGPAINTGGPGTGDPGRISYPRVTLRDLLTSAYGVKADQVLCPEWATTERYSIAAKVPPNATKKEFQAMLQNLLAERFGVVLHREKRDFPVYELVVAQGGPNLRKAATGANDDASPDPAVPMPRARTDNRGFPVLPAGVRQQGTFDNGMMRSTYRRYSMPELANGLGILINASNGDSFTAPPPRVVDKTGLSGEFDFTLEFAGSWSLPSTAAARQEGTAMPAAGAPPGGGPSLFTALEKQLGLKLVKGQKASLDVLVVDHANKTPTGN
jgi:uncharacterized protein (TIGR03435 family)